MVEFSTEELGKNKLIREATYWSIKEKLEEIVSYFQENDRPLIGIAKAFVEDLFPYYRKRDSFSGHVLDQPAPELSRFWREVVLITGFEFGPVENYALATDVGIPLCFLGQIHGELLRSGAYKTSERSTDYIRALFSKVRKDDFKYDSIYEFVQSE